MRKEPEFMYLYDLDTPALVVDLDRLENNISTMAAMVREHGKALRPHTKTHKTPEIARMQVDAGACGITVAKLGEAEVMVDAGFSDLFMANQPVGAPKIERLIALQRRARVMVGVDSLAVAVPIAEAATKAGVQVPVRIEIDTGLHRAGVRTMEEAVSLAKRIASMPGLELAGIFTYEGHAAPCPPEERAAACAEAAAMMRNCAEAMRATGIPINEISMGSTPGARYTAQQEGVTELRPGTYVFYDAMQIGWGASLQNCALTVLTTVISRPEPTVAILDAGTKALSGDRGLSGSKHGLLLEDTAAIFDWANEEHGHIDLREATLRPKVGDKLRIVPFHVCTCVNMHDTMYGIRGEHVEAVWKIAGRGKLL
jgi:D-serine deaminase-like pyridoxal phosphate-dependent protein